MAAISLQAVNHARVSVNHDQIVELKFKHSGSLTIENP